jgi:hypothetical protein
MHPADPKNAFLLMRSNGWSFGSISQKLGIPKSTLFHWESDTATRRTIDVMKSIQLERLQERYLPSFEEELQKLSDCLFRVERALEKQDFEAMRPEFLLRTSLQLRSRLNKLRTDIQPTRTLDQGELPPNPLPGCISRSPTDLDDALAFDPSLSEAANVSATATEKENSTQRNVTSAVADKPSTTQTAENNASADAKKLDENKNSSETKPSSSVTSADQNGTIVPFSRPSCGDTPSPSPGRERYGDLATPLSKIPVHVGADQISLTAGFQSARAPGSPQIPSRPNPSAPPRPCPPNRAASRR